MFFLEMLPRHSFDWFYRLGFHYPVVLGFGLLAAFLYGSCLGSFMNVCIWRIPRGESVAGAPSHCTSCGAEIRWFDNLPVVSYLVLRGRCRRCRAPYSPRYCIVEAATGALFAAVLVKTGLTRQVPAVMIPYCAMILYAIAAGWIDAEHRIIPDLLSVPALLIGLASAAVFPEIWGCSAWYRGILFAAAAALIAGGGLALFALAGRILCRREVLGWGDVKYLAATAALIGLPGALWSLFAGSLLGTAAGILSARIRRVPLRRASIPFAPFLGAAALIWIFAGDALLKLLLPGA